MRKINIPAKTQEKVVTTAYYHLYVMYINMYYIDMSIFVCMISPPFN